MTDVLTFSVYFSTLISSVFLAKLGSRSSRSKIKTRLNTIYILVSLIILVVISGFRYNVGQDYIGYAFYYNEQPFLDESIGMEIEYGFILLVNLLNGLELGVWSYFLISALITYTLLFYSFKRYRHLLYLGVFFFITYGFYFFTFNGVRQAIAMSALGASMIFIQKRQLIPFLGTIFLGGLMHKSLFLFFPLYFFINRIKLPPYVWYLAFFILCQFLKFSISAIFQIF